ncbi:hypothetical protein ALT1545_60184 [Alteromonas macleodii]
MGATHLQRNLLFTATIAPKLAMPLFYIAHGVNFKPPKNKAGTPWLLKRPFLKLTYP